LNHLPAGTSGSVSSQRSSNMSCSRELLRWRTRARRWTSSRSGSFSRRILGIGLPAVESTNNLRLQTVGFSGVFRLDHFLCQFAQLVRRERADFPGFSDKI